MRPGALDACQLHFRNLFKWKMQFGRCLEKKEKKKEAGKSEDVSRWSWGQGSGCGGRDETRNSPESFPTPPAPVRSVPGRWAQRRCGAVADGTARTPRVTRRGGGRWDLRGVGASPAGRSLPRPGLSPILQRPEPGSCPAGASSSPLQGIRCGWSREAFRGFGTEDGNCMVHTVSVVGTLLGKPQAGGRCGGGGRLS